MSRYILPEVMHEIIGHASSLQNVQSLQAVSGVHWRHRHDGLGPFIVRMNKLLDYLEGMFDPPFDKVVVAPDNDELSSHLLATRTFQRRRGNPSSMLMFSGAYVLQREGPDERQPNLQFAFPRPQPRFEVSFWSAKTKPNWFKSLKGLTRGQVLSFFVPVAARAVHSGYRTLYVCHFQGEQLSQVYPSPGFNPTGLDARLS